MYNPFSLITDALSHYRTHGNPDTFHSAASAVATQQHPKAPLVSRLLGAMGRVADRVDNHPIFDKIGKMMDRVENHPITEKAGQVMDKIEKHPITEKAGQAMDYVDRKMGGN